ncbi:MAG TPA: type IV pilus modification protein PilV [Burkholderiales bacterium]|nr:type IV pilus modification protein PilV [Burkholderiales bacterium]
MNPTFSSPPQRGFAILEVLVTLVIVLLGLLGAAGVLVRSHQSSMEAYQRMQALILVEDMVDRISANRPVADCYALTAAGTGTPHLGTGYAGTPSCGLGTPEQQATAIRDLQQWSQLLRGAAETDAAGAFVGAMIGARGCVTFDAASETYSVTVAWQGLGPTAAPPDEIRCGRGLYGDDAQRRAVTLSMQVADL